MGSKSVFRVFQSQYPQEGSSEINKTPGIHHSAVVEPDPSFVSALASEQQRNEFFADARNIFTPPHYIPYDEPFIWREENTQMTRQLLANHLAFLILLLLTTNDLLRVVRSLTKRFSTCKTLR